MAFDRCLIKDYLLTYLSDEQNTKYDNISDTSNDLRSEHSGWTDL